MVLVTRDEVGTASLCPIRVPENKLCAALKQCVKIPGTPFQSLQGKGLRRSC